MRFTRLTAHAHGPFTGETLTPAPGLTVVWGLNEAGKSSWHSAAYLAITGLTRRRGRPSKSEQQIIDRRRPRTGDQWRLEADLHLDDDDHLTVTWDLNQRVAKVLDSLGRDRSNEWLTDGAPDLARIVGLDRASFLATACVRQSDLQRVRDDADILQELLQKAITSADADATASAAITLIEEFRKEQVGLERENSTRPLMEARRRVDATSQALSVAQTAHQDRLDLLTELTARRDELGARRDEHQVLEAAAAVAEARHQHDQLGQQRDHLDQLDHRVEALTGQLDQLDHRERVLLAARHHADHVEVVGTIERQVTETAAVRRAATDADRAHQELRRQLTWAEHEQARRTAHRSRQRSTRATELQQRHPVAPIRPTDHDELAHQAHVLVDRWSKRPTLPALTGPSAADLAQQLAAMPEAPGGDGPTTVVGDHLDAATPAQQRPQPSGPRRSDIPWAIGAGGVAVVGLILGLVVHPALHLLAVAGVVAALVALRHRFRPADADQPPPVFQERLERAEASERAGRHAALTAQLTHRRAQEQRVVEVQKILDQLDEQLAETATAIGADPALPPGQRTDAINQWLVSHSDQRRHLQRANDEWTELTNLLRGGTVQDLIIEADQDEQIWQEQAATVHQLAPLDEDLQVIDHRLLRNQIHQLTGATADAAREAAKLRSQVPGTDPQQALLSAQREADGALQQLRELDDESAERLVGCSIDDLDAQLSVCRTERDKRRQTRDESAGQLRHLQGAAAPTGTGTSSDAGSASARLVLDREQAFLALPNHHMVGLTLDALPAAEVLQSRIDTVADQEDHLHQRVAGLEGRLQERDVPGVSADPATAAEGHAAALRELEQIRELAEVLDETRSLLEAAEDRVHRDIAPRLNAAINRWLPRIFDDRYTKVLIDPANLDVQVFAAGDSFRADLLSQGTTEQFYLLLRVALTETLTAASGESCPLLLDDITVNFDRERKIAVLDLLREVATERQVMIFTQEDDVRSWAQANLSGTDTLIELPGRVTA